MAANKAKCSRRISEIKAVGYEGTSFFKCTNIDIDV